MSKYTNAIRLLAKMKALDAETAEKLLNSHVSEQDGGPGSGNFGHAGRPGKRGGSAPEGGGGGGGSGSSGGRKSSPAPSTSGKFNLTTKDPKKIKELEKVAREYGYKDLSQLQRAARANVRPGELENKPSGPSGKYNLNTTDPKEKARLEKVAKELGYKNLEQMKSAAKGNGIVNKPDGRVNSGNWGHRGNPNGKGGSAKSGTGGTVSGNAGVGRDGTVYRGKDYTLRGRGLSSGKLGPNNPGKTWSAQGKKSKELPNGSGTTKISEADVGTGLHTINRHLNADGTLTPERAALHEKVVQDMFKGKEKPAPGEPKTFYFLGGGSASGKSRFTRPETADTYGVPNRDKCTVVDSDILKNSLPEYNEDSPSGTTDRNKAASFAHEESSALAKRALQAAFDNGYNVTLDGTGDGGEESVLKKIDQARKAGYRVEGRYCTASIENAIQRNIERSKKEHRLVSNDSVINIHKDVSQIFEKVAPKFDHIELWDHDGPKPVKIAECNRNEKVKVLDKKLYKKFLDKANWNG